MTEIIANRKIIKYTKLKLILYSSPHPSYLYGQILSMSCIVSRCDPGCKAKYVTLHASPKHEFQIQNLYDVGTSGE